MNAKPIRDLWFRFVQDTELEDLNAQNIARALSRAGLIELVPHRDKPIFEHYVDAPAMKLIRKVDREREIHKILLAHHKAKEPELGQLYADLERANDTNDVQGQIDIGLKIDAIKKGVPK